MVETLKLIIPQQAAPARRLIGFRNGVLDTQNGLFSPHSKSHWLHAVRRGFSPPVEGETLETHAPNFWRWLDRAAGSRPEKRDVILAALFMVLANRYDWRSFSKSPVPAGAGKVFWPKLRPCSPERITPRRLISTRWKTRASVHP